MAGFGEPQDWTDERNQRMESEYPELADTSADDLLGVDNYAINRGGTATKFSSNAMGLGAHSAAIQRENTSIWGKVKSAGSSLLSNVINPILALDTPLSQRAGYVTSEDADIAEQVAGFTRDELTRPSNIALAIAGIVTGGTSTAGALIKGGTTIAARTAAAKAARSMGQNVLSGVSAQVAAKGVTEVAEYAPDEIGPLAGIASAAAGAYATRGRSMPVRGLATVGAGLTGYASPELAGGLAGGVLAYKGMNKLSSWKDATASIESRTNALDDAVTQSASQALKARVAAEADDAAEIARRAANVAAKPPISYRDLDASHEIADNPAGYFGAESMAQRGILESYPDARFKTGGDGGATPKRPSRKRTAAEAEKDHQDYLDNLEANVNDFRNKWVENGTLKPDYAESVLGRNSKARVAKMADILDEIDKLVRNKTRSNEPLKNAQRNRENAAGDAAKKAARARGITNEAELNRIRYQAKDTARSGAQLETGDVLEFSNSQYNDMRKIIEFADAKQVFGYYDIYNADKALEQIMHGKQPNLSWLRPLKMLLGRYVPGETSAKGLAAQVPFILRENATAAKLKKIASYQGDKPGITRQPGVDDFGNIEGVASEFYGNTPIPITRARLEKARKTDPSMTAAKIAANDSVEIRAAFAQAETTPAYQEANALMEDWMERGGGGWGKTIPESLDGIGMKAPYTSKELATAEKIRIEYRETYSTASDPEGYFGDFGAGSTAWRGILEQFPEARFRTGGDGGPDASASRVGGAAGEAPTSNQPVFTDIDPKTLTFRPDLFQRRDVTAGLPYDQPRVDKLADTFDWDQFDPVKVVHDTSTGQYIVYGGQHRTGAVLKKGFSSMPVRVTEANLSDPAVLALYQKKAALDNSLQRVQNMREQYNAYNTARQTGLTVDEIAKETAVNASRLQEVLDIGDLGGVVLGKVTSVKAYEPIAIALGAAKREFGMSDELAGGLFDRLIKRGNTKTLLTQSATKELLEKYRPVIEQARMFDEQGTRDVLDAMAESAELRKELAKQRTQVQRDMKGVERRGVSSEEVRAAADKELADINQRLSAVDEAASAKFAGGNVERPVDMFTSQRPEVAPDAATTAAAVAAPVSAAAKADAQMPVLAKYEAALRADKSGPLSPSERTVRFSDMQPADAVEAIRQEVPSSGRVINAATSDRASKNLMGIDERGEVYLTSKGGIVSKWDDATKKFVRSPVVKFDPNAYQPRITWKVGIEFPATALDETGSQVAAQAEAARFSAAPEVAPAAAAAADAPTATAPVVEPPTGMAGVGSALRAPSSFQTSKGSTYKVDGQTTTRTKSLHEGHDPADVGLKPPSDLTIYVDPQFAGEVGMWNTLMGAASKRIVLRDNKVFLTSIPDGLTSRGTDSVIHSNIFSNTPEVGLSPLELFEPTAGMYRGNHPGNIIVKMFGRLETPRARVETPVSRTGTPDVEGVEWERIGKTNVGSDDEAVLQKYRNRFNGKTMVKPANEPPLRTRLSESSTDAAGGGGGTGGGTRRTAAAGGEPPSDAPGTQPALSDDLEPIPEVKPWYDHLFADLLSVPRSIKSAFDISAAGRQGIIPSLRHPGVARKSFKAQFKAMRSEQGYLDHKEGLQNKPHAAARDIAGIDVVSQFDNPIRSGEKRIVQQGLDKVFGYRGSARAYDAYLSELRDGLFEVMLRNSGINYTDAATLALPATQKTLRQFGRLINLSTGRLDVLDFLQSQQVQTIGSKLPMLWAPQLLLSRVALPFELFSSNKQVREEIIQELALFVGVNAALLGAMKQFGVADVELDPRSSDFGQIRVGSTRIDPWAGYRPIANLVARIMSGEKKNVSSGDMYDVSMINVVTDFLRTKLEPVTGTAINLVSGEDMGGKKSELGLKTAADLLAPLFLAEMFQAYQVGGAKAAALTAPSVLGIGAGTYESYSDKMDRVGLENMSISERVEVIDALAFRQLYAAVAPRDKVAIGAYGSMTGYLDSLRTKRIEDLMSGKGGYTRLPRDLAIAKAEADMRRLPINLYYSKLKTILENNLIRERPEGTAEYIKEQMDKRPLERRFAPIKNQQRVLAAFRDDDEE